MTPFPTVDDYLERAIGELRSRTDTAQEGLLFLGTWNDAYPAILVRDPFLTDSAKVQWLYLAQEARQQPNSAMAMPPVKETCQVLRQSRGTVIRDRTLLRITRWVSLVRRVRDAASGQFVGSLYAIHGEPATLAEAMRYDADYLQLVEEAARDHRDSNARHAAQAALTGIDQDVAKGTDPLAPVDPIARRLEAAQAVHGGQGNFFGMCYAASKETSQQQCGAPAAAKDTAPGPKFGLGSRCPGPIFGPGKPPSSNFGPGTQPPDFISSTKFGPGVRSSSSSSDKKTTTTDETHSLSSRQSRRDAIDALRWPPSFDNNLRRLLLRTLGEAIDAVHHQDILDALGHKALNKEDPLRNPVSYAFELCRRIRTGEFRPVGPPREIENSHGGPNRGAVVSNLHGEIRALERLREGADSENHRNQLEQQITQLKGQLRDASA